MPSKESKITGIPGPKSNVSANATTTRSGMLSSGSSKRNQNAHPSKFCSLYLILFSGFNSCKPRNTLQKENVSTL